MKTVTSKTGRKYKFVDGSWRLMRSVGGGRKPKKFSPHHREDVISARVNKVRKLVKRGASRTQIAAVLRSFRKADGHG